MSDFLQQQGLNVTSLAPDEVGIKTDNNYSNANIITIETSKIVSLFNEYETPLLVIFCISH